MARGRVRTPVPGWARPVRAVRRGRIRIPAHLPRATATLAAALLALGLSAVAAPSATALPKGAAVAGHSEPTPATVTVTGQGSATAAPDALLRAVREHGVADRDVRTEELFLNPVHQYQDGTSQLTGYQAAPPRWPSTHPLPARACRSPPARSRTPSR